MTNNFLRFNIKIDNFIKLFFTTVCFIFILILGLSLIFLVCCTTYTKIYGLESHEMFWLIKYIENICIGIFYSSVGVFVIVSIIAMMLGSIILLL